MDFGVRHTQILLLPIGLDQVKECLQAYYLQKIGIMIPTWEVMRMKKDDVHESI